MVSFWYFCRVAVMVNYGKRSVCVRYQDLTVPDQCGVCPHGSQ